MLVRDNAHDYREYTVEGESGSSLGNLRSLAKGAHARMHVGFCLLFKFGYIPFIGYYFHVFLSTICIVSFDADHSKQLPGTNGYQTIPGKAIIHHRRRATRLTQQP